MLYHRRGVNFSPTLFCSVIFIRWPHLPGSFCFSLLDLCDENLPLLTFFEPFANLPIQPSLRVIIRGLALAGQRLFSISLLLLLLLSHLVERMALGQEKSSPPFQMIESGRCKL